MISIENRIEGEDVYRENPSMIKLNGNKKAPFQEPMKLLEDLVFRFKKDLPIQDFFSSVFLFLHLQ